MESTACFANNLMDLREQGGSIPRDIPTSDIEKFLESYAQKRRARVSNAMQNASSACRTQLKIGPEAEACILGLPDMKDEAWLSEVLISLSEAEKIENWKNDSVRVDFYDQQAGKIRQEVQQAGYIENGT